MISVTDEELFVNKWNKKEEFARETVTLKFVIHFLGFNAFSY